LVNPIHKGKRGENELCLWLKANLDLNVDPERNYNQSKRGSSDIVNVAGWAFEVKRREVLSLDDWWWQVCVSVKKHYPESEPVVAFRQNRKPWEFLISARAIGLELGYIRLKDSIFINYANRAIRGHYPQEILV